MSMTALADQNRFVLVWQGVAWTWHPDGLRPLFVGARQPARRVGDGERNALGELGTIGTHEERHRSSSRRYAQTHQKKKYANSPKEQEKIRADQIRRAALRQAAKEARWRLPG